MEEFREPYRRAAAATALSVDTVAEIVEEELAAGVFKGYAPGSDPRDSVATTARQRSV
jgi:DNA-binding Lrp family transcriptional regulator